MSPLKILVTGGTGFLGSHFLGAALAAGHEVIALRYGGTRNPIPLEQEPQWVDGTLASMAGSFPEGVDVLVHLAAVGVDPLAMKWETCFQGNVVESLALWRAAADAGVRRLVVCGSCFEYGRSAERVDFVASDAPLEPVGPYAASKAAASLAAMALSRERMLETAVLRPFHIFGEGEAANRFWPSLRRAALAGEDFPMTTGEQVRDFAPAEAVAAAFLRSLEVGLKPGMPQIFHVGTGRPKTLREFAEGWWKTWGAKGRLLFGAVPYRPNEVMRYVPGPVFI